MSDPQLTLDFEELRAPRNVEFLKSFTQRMFFRALARDIYTQFTQIGFGIDEDLALLERRTERKHRMNEVCHERHGLTS